MWLKYVLVQFTLEQTANTALKDEENPTPHSLP